jgi:hypothetical protein
MIGTSETGVMNARKTHENGPLLYPFATCRTNHDSTFRN